MFQNRLILHPNPQWPSCHAPIPEVAVYFIVQEDRLQIRWEVHEGSHTFRCEVSKDGGPCWQDSCVEAFILSANSSGSYLNFEFNPRGVCLAAKGKSRMLRRAFTQGDYFRILRRPSLKSIPSSNQSMLNWSLEVEIPADMLGVSRGTDLRTIELFGNAYKCGDKSSCPHWLSAFPIDTPKPDFHRPEYFRKLNS